MERGKYKKDEIPSNIRKKAKKMENSRDNWKEKNQKSQYSLKILKARFQEIVVSRESWKEGNRAYAEEIKNYQEKIKCLEEKLLQEKIEKECLQFEIDTFKKKLKRNQ